MPDLVASPVVGPAFVDVLRRAWDEGAAVFPLDPRYPEAVREAVLARVRPTHWEDEAGRRPLEGGVGVEEGDAVVLATSGTTSTPKGVVLTHAALAHAAVVTTAQVGADPATDRWLCCSPVAHAAGLGVVNRALRSGTPLEVLPRFDPGAVDAAAAAGATLTALVPTVLPRIDVARWRLIVLGGMAMPPGLPPNTTASYGLTETMGGVVYDGRTLPEVDVRTVDGHVELRSPTLLRCYRTEAGEHDPKDADGWFRTGDEGHVDDAGLLHVHGRSDDVVVTGGEKVWPDVVEAVLRRLPGVAEAAVVGRSDPEWGQRVVAVLELDRGAEAPSLDAARAAVREVLAPWCCPRELEVVDALPRTPSGKVRRTALRN